MGDSRFSLRSFEPFYAACVASWVRTEQELFWLAPSTPFPLTVNKVVGWTRRRGQAFLMFSARDLLPCAYGELNPMQSDLTHLWLGHLLVDPLLRRQGLGRWLIQLLTDHAFTRSGARRLTLVVFPENLGAIRCYEQMGFRFKGEEQQCFRGLPQRYRLLRFEMDTARVAPLPNATTAAFLESPPKIAAL